MSVINHVMGGGGGAQIIPITTSNWEITADDNYVKFTFPPGVDESNLIAIACMLRLAWFDGPHAGGDPDCGATFFLRNISALSGYVSLDVTGITEISLGTVIVGGNPYSGFEEMSTIERPFEADGFEILISDLVSGNMLNSFEVVDAPGIVTVRA